MARGTFSGREEGEIFKFTPLNPEVKKTGSK
jgi:hypothetical protein